jgi:hypothetical protein
MGRAASVESVRERIEAWRRRSGGPGRRIPEALWLEAVEVTRVHGVEEASRMLELDRRRLERRAASESLARGPEASALEFVEMPFGSADGGRVAAAVEFVGADGDRVRVEIPAGQREVGRRQANSEVEIDQERSYRPEPCDAQAACARPIFSVCPAP